MINRYAVLTAALLILLTLPAMAEKIAVFPDLVPPSYSFWGKKGDRRDNGHQNGERIMEYKKMDGHSSSESNIILYGLIIVVGCAVLYFVRASVTVQEEIDTICEEACSRFPGPKVDALVTYLEKSSDLNKKNRIIWTLGELRDPKALPILEKLCTGQPCDHSRYVCQKELEKAIKKIKKEIPNPYFWK